VEENAAKWFDAIEPPLLCPEIEKGGSAEEIPSDATVNADADSKNIAAPQCCLITCIHYLFFSYCFMTAYYTILIVISMNILDSPPNAKWHYSVYCQY